MKIFLNDRTIQFQASGPANGNQSELVAEFQSPDQLEVAWEDFKRYEKYRSFVIVDPEFIDNESSSAFIAFRSFFKFIPAAGGLVRNEKGEYLFIHRLGLWDLPKGKVDRKDIPGPGHMIFDTISARNAATREVEEETGLTGLIVKMELVPTWHIYTVREKWILKKTRWFEMEADSAQKLKPQTSEGIFLVKWIPPKGIHCVLSHTYDSLRELLLEQLF